MGFFERFFGTNQDKAQRRAMDESEDLPISTLRDTKGNPLISHQEIPSSARRLASAVTSIPGDLLASAKERANPSLRTEVEELGDGYVRVTVFKGKRLLKSETIDGSTYMGQMRARTGAEPGVDLPFDTMPADLGKYYSAAQMKRIRGK